MDRMAERTRHHLNAAWRRVVESWLRREGWIAVRQNQQTKVSTNSNDFYSHINRSIKDFTHGSGYDSFCA